MPQQTSQTEMKVLVISTMILLFLTPRMWKTIRQTKSQKSYMIFLFFFFSLVSDVDMEKKRKLWEMFTDFCNKSWPREQGDEFKISRIKLASLSQK